MRKKRLVLVMVFLTVVMTATAFASLSQFSGNWKNIDPNTGGITTLNIIVSGKNVQLEAWGKCHPTDCYWGKVVAYAYAPNVSSDLVTTANTLSAIFNTNFSQTIMIIYPQMVNRIEAKVLTHFTDNSNRTDYTNVYTFTRTVSPILPAPVQVSPPNGSVFNHFPRTTRLVWRPVAGASSYTVEIDCYHCCQRDKWCTEVGRTWKIERNLTTTSYTFDFVGAQPGRWRVWAVGANGQSGAQSGWWEFRYTR